MRPQILNHYFKSLSSFPGIGPQREKSIEKNIGPYPIDLLFHLPYALETRYEQTLLSECVTGTKVTIALEIIDIQKKSQYTTIWASDGQESLALTYFNANSHWLKKLFTIGHKKLISGKIDVFSGYKQIVHPDFVGSPNMKEKWIGSKPLYRSINFIGQYRYRSIIQEILKTVPELPEWIPSDIMSRYKWPSFLNALKTVHNPKAFDDLSPDSSARMRLAFDELYHYQLCLNKIDFRSNQRQRYYENKSDFLRQKTLDIVPFELTNNQKEVLQKLDNSLGSTNVMRTLLMGDVGSGKTIVAFLACLKVIENNAQVAFLAPTTLLAQQHYQTLLPYCKKLGININLLTSDSKDKNTKKRGLESGETSLVIGTHALIQESIVFKNLALIIIDEQHRFGVEQRQILTNRSPTPDLLYLSATPIPRTLAMTLYGQMDILSLKEKPKNRMPIETLIMPKDKLISLYQWIQKIITQGFKVYWVCPLIEKNDDLPITSIEEKLPILKQYFPNKVTMVHGQMKAADKEKSMHEFRFNDQKSILLSTTVIEVGVDVPEATVIVIENAERFGLSQLHQLRGRVGRNQHKSYCILTYDPPLSQTAQQRLKVMKISNDGFHIAEEDLKIRGSGDLLGTEQSGLPKFRLASLADHIDLIKLARGAAQKNSTTNLDQEILASLFKQSNTYDI
ncbi:MAG: ATP-dependent DNA helicase RecG [Rickettsiales bacterium]|nr:ATP-dependent DNA helicase RecG [Rickettsiales bacterium]|tara:strand:+ start:22040 stop:24073 length:2034 start_codon:yes stop_codon:yes gene_type:complete